MCQKTMSYQEFQDLQDLNEDIIFGVAVVYYLMNAFDSEDFDPSD